ncbi:Protein of unknown function [Gracilibacillus ureilyticus]|uniref:DUF421 domain-containing protein n=1 Tax=Gracilibacillus ureilyticus TaxID=531814 RepID=A0A1H9RDV0_9BACI|nr:YetF domain-containing protein [Gracilibacillus ureilyticus]SER70888.1 Protein of unknown function [Gracilibacillus ureilyticus]
MALPYRFNFSSAGNGIEDNSQKGSVRMLDALLFDNTKTMIRAALMCLLAYPFLLFLLRLFGKRTLTQINLFDFIITITYGATLSTILTNDKVTFAQGAAILFMLTFLQYIVAKLSAHSKIFADIIKAAPSFLYYEGTFYEKQMQKHRIQIEDIRAAVRKQGMISFDQVEAVVLEGDGTLSVIKKDEGSSKEALRGIARK